MSSSPYLVFPFLNQFANVGYLIPEYWLILRKFVETNPSFVILL